MGLADAVILNRFENVILNDAVAARTVQLVKERLEALQPIAQVTQQTMAEEANELDSQIARLINFIAKGHESSGGRRSTPHAGAETGGVNGAACSPRFPCRSGN